MKSQTHRKVALVTGSGARRVGNAIAVALAERGYTVAIHYNRSEKEAQQTVAELRAKDVEAEAFQADVAVAAEAEQLIERVLKHFGRLDVLVTAAAIWQCKPLEAVTEDDVRRNFEVNTLGTFFCCRAAGLAMVKQPEGGAIVAIGDWATERPYRDYAAYFISKGAIPTITRMLAVELAARNPAVRVNCVLPGPVMFAEDLPKAERDRSITGTLVGREGRPENVAQAVVALVENDFITGVCLPVDGGRTIKTI